MTDIKIAQTGPQWGAVLVDGDFVLTGDEGQLEEVTQRVIYALMTWSGESRYDLSAGMPYGDDGILGSSEFEGISGLFFQEIIDTEGVDDVTSFDFSVSDRVLTLTFAIRVGAAVSDDIEIEITA